MTLVFAVFGQQLAGDVTGALRVARLLAGFHEATGDLSHASTELALVACLELVLGDAQGAAGSYLEKAASVTSPYDAASGPGRRGATLLAGRRATKPRWYGSAPRR